MSCDCPACQRLCQRTGRKCFVPCVECIATVEYDEIGAITSQTVRLINPYQPPTTFDMPPSIYSEAFWQAMHEAGWLKEGEA